jgi:3-phytase
MRRSIRLAMTASLATLLSACAIVGPDPRGDLPRVAETWISASTPADNIDSVASWRTSEGKLLVAATAKTGDSLRLYDGDSGVFLRSISGAEGAGALKRPNGVFVAGNLAFVVERDNHRVQVFDLQRNASIGVFGGEQLRFPYGLWVWPQDDGSFRVFVTDNYETENEEVPPDVELDERVRIFNVRVAAGGIEARLIRSFGETRGEGMLRRVESIWGDPLHNRLLVADEDASRSDIKIYDLEGRYTGALMGQGVFRNEPEGIALVDCGNASGYWIVSDQHTPHQIVRIFDRESLALLGSFAPAATHTVDGIWFEPEAQPTFPRGALFTQHDDAAVSAFDWQAIASSMGLREDCPAQGR